MSRLWITVLACAGFATASVSGAAPPDKADKGKAGQKAQGGEHAGKAKHRHVHANGKQLLGAKLKQDGKHAVGKFKDRTVEAEVKGGKVRNMTAGDLPVKRVRTKTKMAYQDGAIIQASWSGTVQLAQYDSYYYGYCFDDGYDYDCYWYPEEDVDYQDYTWEDYDPYY